MKCPKCGADYSADALACPYCGEANTVGVQRKNYKEKKHRFLEKKEKETAKKSLPEAISNALFWIMIVSIGLIPVSIWGGAALVSWHEAREEARAQELEGEHLAYLEGCWEAGNYGPMESYLVEHELYGDPYGLYLRVADCYSYVTNLRDFRNDLMKLEPGSKYFEEDLENCCRRIVEYSMALVQYDDKAYLYGEIPQEMAPLLQEYQLEAVTTMANLLGYYQPEMEEIFRLNTYSDEMDTYINMAVERVKKINGWQ